jgi:hypothetical protein
VRFTRLRHEVLAADVFGEGAEARAIHLVAGREVGHVRANGFDDPGHVEAQDVVLRPAQALAQAGEVRLASEHVPVEGVDRRRTNPHEHTAIGDARLFDLLDLEEIGWATPVADDRLHRRFLKRSEKVATPGGGGRPVPT